MTPINISADERYLTGAELAERQRRSLDTVRDWRKRGIGPRGVRMGRRVLYPLSEVVRWEAEQVEQDVVAARRDAR